MRAVESGCCRTAWEERCLRELGSLTQDERETQQILSVFTVKRGSAKW